MCITVFSSEAEAVLAYVRRGRVVADSIAEKLLFVDGNDKLLTTWQGEGLKPEIFACCRPPVLTRAMPSSAGMSTPGDSASLPSGAIRCFNGPGCSSMPHKWQEKACVWRPATPALSSLPAIRNAFDILVMAPN